MAASIGKENENVKLSKSERKLRKKQTKSQHTLLKHDGIKASEVPTRILCVNNAGLDSCVSRDEVYHLFQVYGRVEDVISIPQKPYAFVCYCKDEDAEVAYRSLNGQKLPETNERKWSVTMYISYVSQVPPSLAPTEVLPPGLILLNDFVTQDYADRLLESIKWNEEGTQRELKHREVKHYGYEFQYGINDVDPNAPLPQGVPDICGELLDKALRTGHVQHIPDQLTINKYQSGQGIPSHVDTPAAFEDGIMSLSLGSQILMEFRHPNGQHLSILLPPRSLLIMTGESRYLWSHGITPRKSDIVSTPVGRLTISHRGTRTSFTFRKIIHPKDRINRHIPFSSQIRQPDLARVPQSSSDATRLEETHVHKVYEEIADHFSGTRHSPWPRIADFVREQSTGSILADIGCGNGKYLGINKAIFEVGSDRSASLAGICRSRGFPVFVSDVMSIPIRSGVCDVCLCIAVLHHLSTEERRLHGLSELLRILRPGGQALIYVWAMEQELHKVKSKYLREVKVTGSEEVNVAETEDKVTDSTKVEVTDSTEVKVTESEPAEIGATDTAVSSETTTIGSLPLENSVYQLDCEKEKIASQENDLLLPSCHRLETNPEINSRSVDKTCEACGKASTLSQESQSSEHSVNCEGLLEIHKNRTSFKQQDMLVPWQLKKGDKDTGVKVTDQGSAVFHRYYHVFRQGELEALCGRLENCRVVRGYYDQGNWAVVLQKL